MAHEVALVPPNAPELVYLVDSIDLIATTQGMAADISPALHRTMNKSAPNLPGLYELVVVEETDNAAAHARRLARDGAEEGTFVWAKTQAQGPGRPGKSWIPGEGNLHCAVILRPGEPLETCSQLSLLTAVCVAQAITLVGEPMEELRLGWPNDVYLNRGKVAGVHLSGQVDAGNRVEWMVIAVNINTASRPEGLGLNAASLHGEGFEVSDRIDVLEGFAREFLAWLNRWAEEGMEPVRKAWLWRGGWRDAERSVEVDGREVRGMFDSLDYDGALKLQTEEGIMTVNLVDFHRSELTANT